VQVNGLDVMIYFWDERDGVGFCGWWFGPKVGGDQVWAYHADKTSVNPPQTGWKVPYDGPVDASMAITPKRAGVSQQQQMLQQQQQQAQQQQQGGKGGWGGQQQQQGGWGGQQGGQQGNPAEAQRLAQQRAQLEQLKQKQMEEQKKRLEENRRKLDEANASRQLQQQQKMAEMKQQQEELARKRAEEMKARQEQVLAQRAEQEAVLKIRRSMQKFKASSMEKYEEYKVEFDEVVKAELDNCGSQKERLVTECEQAVEATKKRMADLEEAKRLDDERKAAETARRKELKVKAEALLVDLGKLIEDAEAAGKSVTEEAEPLFDGDKKMKADGITACHEAVVKAIEEANKKMAVCSEFVLKETPNIRDIPPIEGEPVTCAQDLAKMLGRLTEVKKSVTTITGTSASAKTTKLKKAAATEEHEKHMAIFKKYDSDKDGKLSRKEIQNYAKGEFKFTMSAESLDKICDALVVDGSKGVPKEQFQRVKFAVGIARELVADGKLREKREQKEKELVQAKDDLQGKVDKTKTVIEATDAAIAKVEALLSPDEIKKIQQMTSVETAAACDDIDKGFTEAKQSVEETREQIAALSKDVDASLKGFLDLEVRKLNQLTTSWDSRVSKTAASGGRIRVEGVKKNATELEALRAQVIGMIKHHQAAKSLDNEAMFKAIAKNGKIGEAEFIKFIKSCEKKEDSKVPSDADLSRAFEYVEESDEGHFTEEQFVSLVRVYMKVSKATVMTEEISMKSTPLRRLEAGEVLELLQAPKKEEEDSTVERAQVKAMKDGVVGWVAPVGDQGTEFLVAGGSTFKVVKDTILTTAFEIAGDKDETRKLKDTTRKLKAGEVVEVREWAKKEEASGLMRMKVRVKSDGQIGWATSLGNTGIVFLEVV